MTKQKKLALQQIDDYLSFFPSSNSRNQLIKMKDGILKGSLSVYEE